MRDFFSLDGAFTKYGGFIADTLILSLMWVLFSIPIVTIGAATSAMFFVSTRRISDREGYITGDFWMAFKANFAKATKLWLLILLLVAILLFNIQTIEIHNTMTSLLYSAQLVFLLLIALVSVFVFPMTARFDMKFTQVLKSSFFMSLRHIPTTLACIAMLVAMLFLVDFIIIFIIAVPGLYAMGASFLIMRIFKKYRPEMDKDPILELQEIEAQKAEERRMQGIAHINSDEDSFEEALEDSAPENDNIDDVYDDED